MREEKSLTTEDRTNQRGTPDGSTATNDCYENLLETKKGKWWAGNSKNRLAKKKRVDGTEKKTQGPRATTA